MKIYIPPPPGSQSSPPQLRSNLPAHLPLFQPSQSLSSPPITLSLSVQQTKGISDQEIEEGFCSQSFFLMDGKAKAEKQVEDIEDEIRDPLLSIKVLFFARARDLSGTAETDLSVPVGFTAHDCLIKLMTIFPRLEEIRNCIVVALNQEYVRESTVLKNGDELAIIPPISGG